MTEEQDLILQAARIAFEQARNAVVQAADQWAAHRQAEQRNNLQEMSDLLRLQQSVLNYRAARLRLHKAEAERGERL